MPVLYGEKNVTLIVSFHVLGLGFRVVSCDFSFEKNGVGPSFWYPILDQTMVSPNQRFLPCATGLISERTLQEYTKRTVLPLKSQHLVGMFFFFRMGSSCPSPDHVSALLMFSRPPTTPSAAAAVTAAAAAAAAALLQRPQQQTTTTATTCTFERVLGTRLVA